MNLSKLKNYAPQARLAFVSAMTDRAAFYGVTALKAEPVVDAGAVVMIGGRQHPRSVMQQRYELDKLVQQLGFSQTMEVLAYTWFNRLLALRFMELQGYLDHGYRVLSHPEGKAIPELLEHAEHLSLPGLDPQRVIDLKLDGTKDSELYRLLLIAQCNALHATLPFLFGRVDDLSELLLPDNLLHSDSILRKLVAEIPEEDWNSVEILGWLYQFYISDRKDEVMARKSAVPTEDIPAVTQLFTPHWIVRYLVENSLGRLWLLNRPGSSLREHMQYYIEGEAQTEFLRISKPEEIRLLDPAVGSGHMLTYAFDLLYLIYQEEGYVPHEIPGLILRHNLHGLEICPRAAQLAQLALVLKARDKSRRFFQPGQMVQPHILALQNVRFSERELATYFEALGSSPSDLNPQLPELLRQFEDATTFGSLIQPCMKESEITAVRTTLDAKDLGSQLLLRDTDQKIRRILAQAEMLCQRYQIVVANPPYMGSKGMNGALKNLLEKSFTDYKSDLFAAFIVRSLSLSVTDGYMGFMSPFVWMFISSYEELRRCLISKATITTLVQLEYSGFDGATVPICAFAIQNKHHKGYHGGFIRLSEFRGSESQGPRTLEAIENPNCGWFFRASADDFGNIPGSPIAYWASSKFIEAYQSGVLLSELLDARIALATGDNDRFIRLWSEVPFEKIGFSCLNEEDADKSGAKWFPCNKGGEYRRWYGNNLMLVNWHQKGAEIRSFSDEKTGRIRSHNYNGTFAFKECITWSAVSSSKFGARLSADGFMFATPGSCAFLKNTSRSLRRLLGFLCSNTAEQYLRTLSSTMNIEVGTLLRIPFLDSHQDAETIAEACIVCARADWDNFETSWDFRDLPLLREGTKGATLTQSWRNWEEQSLAAIRRMQELETENNRLFIDAYGLAGELSPEVPEEQITLARPNARADVASFLSYAVGCMMGRYSLDKPGLILANAGDTVAQYLEKVGLSQEQLRFAPDDDGIIPVLDGEWFADDVVTRTREFLRVTFGEESLSENLRFIEESLGKDLRQYFLTDFYKNHLQTYKRRPIYWMFCSGKQRAFQCLVYLHRYHEGTLSRLRTEYVIALQSRMAARIEQLETDKTQATSTSHRKKLQKEQDDLKKQQTELLAFDEKLKHLADRRIKLDLDDGVKVNYGKFGELLAEVKAVTGGSDE